MRTQTNFPATSDSCLLIRVPNRKTVNVSFNIINYISVSRQNTGDKIYIKILTEMEISLERSKFVCYHTS